MKAKLEFNIDDWEDKLAHRRCVNADTAYIALFTISNYVTELWNLSGDNKELETIIRKINEALAAVDLDDLP